LRPQQRLAEAPALPELPGGGGEDEDDSMFTERDWHNVLRGYTSQHAEHDFPIPDIMLEGELLRARSCCVLRVHVDRGCMLAGWMRMLHVWQ
jgi:hypothetical protein